MEYLRLFEWYHENKRDLPFRKTKNPYDIWVSEVMLQQTQVESMLPYFDKFMKKYPTIHDLANAELEEVLHTVQGIGYYKRFRMLKQGAIYVDQNFNGELPNDYKELLKIPGVGAYTAGAIASIAFDLPHAATDGNVIRVLSRVYGFEDDFRLEKNRKKLNDFNTKLIEKAPNYNDYTQSVMELGAKVCRPLNPKCEVCPLKDICVANKEDKIEKYPYLSPLKKQKETLFYAFVVKYKDKFVLRKRTEELLNGFYEFIQVEADSLNGALNQMNELGYDIEVVEELKDVKHVFTHLIWHIKPVIVIASKIPDNVEIYSDFKGLPIATVHQKILKQL
ncbi:A/G-specific adenine glycosylase [Acholeplasma hippikon]|nr:A/G-specific adenine glycosylase [Acholeplasma hippikon]